MNVLAITNLFPNNVNPQQGIFNKQQFIQLAKLCSLEVVAPVPWAPKIRSNDKRMSLADVAGTETIDGIKVYHPRYLVTPKIGRSFYGFWFYAGIVGTVRKIYQDFPFDIILATWAYPDAFAASLVARQISKPLVIKVHGTDVNVTSQYFLRRAMMKYALNRAENVIAVSYPLKEKLIKMGIAAEKIVVIPNGVDAQMFQRMDKDECQKKLSLPQDKKNVVYVGNLAHVKGVQYLIEAFTDVSDQICLHLVGDGDDREKLEGVVNKRNLAGNIKFYGRRPHQEIPYWLSAADVFCLPSLNEGCPNVILEALACETPIVATRVGAIPEMILSEEQGMLVDPANARALAETINAVLSKPRNYFSTIQPKKLSWQENAGRVKDVLHNALR